MIRSQCSFLRRTLFTSDLHCVFSSTFCLDRLSSHSCCRSLLRSRSRLIETRDARRTIHASNFLPVDDSNPSVVADGNPPGTREKEVPVNPELEEFIRLPSDEKNVHASRDYGFNVSFLGTGSGQVSVHRGNSATALRMGSQTYLFDAGEGTQKQLMLSRIRMGDIKKIFSEYSRPFLYIVVVLILPLRGVYSFSLNSITDFLLSRCSLCLLSAATVTHMHGDHIFGLPGLLLRLQTIVKPKESNAIIQVFGPVGLYNYIAHSLSLSCSELNVLRVEVYELQGGSRRWRHPGGSRSYSEFRHRGLIRKTVPQNSDGTWTLQTLSEMTTPEKAAQSSHSTGVYVKAAELQHTPKTRCFGFVVQEPQLLPTKIDKDLAIAAGVQPSDKYRLLKLGLPVMSDDGSREVQPTEVLIGEKVEPRKFALLGDCCYVPPPMRKLCQDADVLVHEATLTEHETGRKVEHGGHSTALEAGRVASDVNAKVLALTHLPPVVRSNTSVKSIVQEAQRGTQGRTRVQVAFDFMEIEVPKSGYRFSSPAKHMNVKKSSGME